MAAAAAAAGEMRTTGMLVVESVVPGSPADGVIEAGNQGRDETPLARLGGPPSIGTRPLTLDSGSTLVGSCSQEDSEVPGFGFLVKNPGASVNPDHDETQDLPNYLGSCGCVSQDLPCQVLKSTRTWPALGGLRSRSSSWLTT